MAKAQVTVRPFQLDDGPAHVDLTLVQITRTLDRYRPPPSVQGRVVCAGERVADTAGAVGTAGSGERTVPAQGMA
ncbi:hypothetical protein BKE56_001820 [Rhodococcus sp. M8]|nr:hypothetical protein BKE56_001820 [Rhodococcus sp. M8]